MQPCFKDLQSKHSKITLYSDSLTFLVSPDDIFIGLNDIIYFGDVSNFRKLHSVHLFLIALFQ